jgi:hypothetical protein
MTVKYGGRLGWDEHVPYMKQTKHEYCDVYVIARKRLGKQARNKYTTNNRADPLLMQRLQYTHATTEQVLQEVFSMSPPRGYITRSQK